MAAGIWFLLATFGLCWSTTDSAKQPLTETDSRYNRTLQAIVDILWTAFTAEIRNEENVLLFSIPYATDVMYIDSALAEETKKEVRKSIPLYDGFESDARVVDDEFRRVSSNEMRFKTVFYGTYKALMDGRFYGLIYNKILFPNDRFVLVNANRKDDLDILFRLAEEIEVGSIGVTCEVRYCPVQEILFNKPPFAVLTLATWNVASDAGLQWIAGVEFALSETSSTQVEVFRSYSNHEYAEFRYPLRNECTGRALRLPYKPGFNLTFVIPSAEDKRCSSSEDLWKNVQNVNLNELKFKRQTMFVSIPRFNVSANIDLKMKLRGTVLAQAFDQQSSRLYNSMAFQAAEVLFSPKVPKSWPVPAISGDIPSFMAERPFFFALFHATSRAPIFAGFINNPGCIRKCDEIEIDK